VSPASFLRGGGLQAAEGGVAEGIGIARHVGYGRDGDAKEEGRPERKRAEAAKEERGGEGGRKRAACPCGDNVVWKSFT